MNITENIIYIILENGTKKRATYLYTSIRLPKVSANSDKIVFRKDYQMYVYDLG
jgi:tricorn protease